MRKIYSKILIGMVFILWIVYIIQTLNTGKEGFTPKIYSLYRPYIRTFNHRYESFVNNFGPNVIINKLRKWNIY